MTCHLCNKSVLAAIFLYRSGKDYRLVINQESSVFNYWLVMIGEIKKVLINTVYFSFRTMEYNIENKEIQLKQLQYSS